MDVEALITRINDGAGTLLIASPLIQMPVDALPGIAAKISKVLLALVVKVVRRDRKDPNSGRSHPFRRVAGKLP